MANPQNEELASDVIDVIVDVAGAPLKSSAETALTRAADQPRRSLDAPVGALSAAAKLSPLDLIETSLRMGASLEQVREMITLARDMDKDEARKLFFAALAQFK